MQPISPTSRRSIDAWARITDALSLTFNQVSGPARLERVAEAVEALAARVVTLEVENWKLSQRIEDLACEILAAAARERQYQRMIEQSKKMELQNAP